MGISKKVKEKEMVQSLIFLLMWTKNSIKRRSSIGLEYIFLIGHRWPLKQ